MRLKEPAVFEKLSDMLAGFVRTQAIFIAVQLGVPDVVSEAPTDVHRIASRVGADESSLYRLLRFLSSEEIFREAGPRKFVENPFSNGLRVNASSGASWLAMLLGTENYHCRAD